MQYETFIPFAVQFAMVPPAPKSQSSGCAITTRIRLISSSGIGLAIEVTAVF
jgi:hypothetical protein